MNFFDREEEMASLREINERSKNVSQFTVVTGRRRIGKTSLVWKAYDDRPILYFFVARKIEADLCESFLSEMQEKLDVPMVGHPVHFAEIFEFLMRVSVDKPITVFIDEFQEFSRVNPSVFSDMQRIWDEWHERSHINLIVCGSIFSMMEKIFKNKKEPLYNRQTNFINVRHFSTMTLKEILHEYNAEFTSEDLLALFSFTGGIAKYVQLLIDAGATTKTRMLNQIVRQDSIFIGEGKASLIEEFGRDYGVYFSILSAISRGKTSRSEIEDAVGREIGGYLTNLEQEYELISKRQPLFESSKTKNVRYFIDDNFFNFWFRFIYKYNYMIEIGNYEALKTIISRDYETFSGLMLKRYFRQKLAESHEYTRLGGWWDRKGENEIDIVAENEFDSRLDFFEVKRKAENINLDILHSKAEAFLRVNGNLDGRTISCRGLSMRDM